MRGSLSPVPGLCPHVMTTAFADCSSSGETVLPGSRTVHSALSRFSNTATVLKSFLRAHCESLEKGNNREKKKQNLSTTKKEEKKAEETSQQEGSTGKILRPPVVTDEMG